MANTGHVFDAEYYPDQQKAGGLCAAVSEIFRIGEIY
jgi:hypothetical protein